LCDAGFFALDLLTLLIVLLIIDTIILSELLTGQTLMTEPNRYTQAVDDGLRMRESQDYARYKLRALQRYLEITGTSMKDKWTKRCYLDLQAGPGKNRIGSEVVLGSPLIALSVTHPFTEFFFNELRTEAFKALETRLEHHPLQPKIHLSNKDVNQVAIDISVQRKSRNAQSLNVAFLDPEGLELHWEAIEALASLKTMDLIINFSTMGIKRVVGVKDKDQSSLTRFFGNERWREIADGTTPHKNRDYIDLYLEGLKKYDYKIQVDPNVDNELPVKNSKNAEVYRLIFASKHP
jgi:three-Cys-motif partner protein